MKEDLVGILLLLALFIPFAAVLTWGILQLTKPMFPEEEKK